MANTCLAISINKYQNELSRRLVSQLGSRCLAFSCYRIRRRWSLPLPVTVLPKLDLKVRGFAQPYPWQIWCLWALEERLYALSGAAMFLEDQGARERCIEDLEALAHWPHYAVANKLDLPYGHAVQLMAMALQNWVWLPESTQQSLRRGLQRAVEEGLPLVPPAVLALASPEELLGLPLPHHHLHNIPLIAQAALASAAEVIDHPEHERLSSRFLHLFQARLTLYHQALTEGISYDGYLYNFALGWLGTQSNALCQSIVNHPAMQDLESQARGLACPGQIAQSAEIGDVEPLEMAFVWSALARMQQWAFSGAREALLEGVHTEQLRADALWVRAQQAGQKVIQGDSIDSDQPYESPDNNVIELAVVQQSTAAVTLATGLGDGDLSVVMSLCCSPMNHIQSDSGTLLIGHAGHWWITDPGYQQYLKTSERGFTLGPEAHNTPVINGFGQAHKAGKLIYSGACMPLPELNGAYLVADLTACYPVEAQAETVTRTLWRLGRDQVVVCDTVVAVTDASVAYHWHGDADACWGELAGAVSLYSPSDHRTLWIQSGHHPLSLAQQHRLRGSRGHCTLHTSQPSSVSHHWWSFCFADTAPSFDASGLQAHVGAAHLQLADLIPDLPLTPSLEISVRDDLLLVAIRCGDEPLQTVASRRWSITLSINEVVIHSLASRPRQTLLPIPAIANEDSVTISARPEPSCALGGEVIEHCLTASEKADIRSTPLRVYVEVSGCQVLARCLLQPGVLRGEVEYAFYLLIDGHKSQTRWYAPSERHSFVLSEHDLSKDVRVRGFVRACSVPDEKISALSSCAR